MSFQVFGGPLAFATWLAVVFEGDHGGLETPTATPRVESASTDGGTVQNHLLALFGAFYDFASP